MNEEQKKMRPLKTGEVMRDIYAIDNHFVNFFIIKLGDKIVALDSGADVDFSLAELEKIGVKPADIDAVLLTHDHGDHTALLSQFTNAQIYAFNEKIAGHDAIKPIKINDGDQFNLFGMDVEVIHTPGHKSNHVSFLVFGDILLAGDMMSIQAGNEIELFNEVYNESNEQQKKDIEKIKGMGKIKHIITSHYGWM